MINGCCFNNEKPIRIVLSLNKLKGLEDCKKIKDNGFENITYPEVFENIKSNLSKYISGASLSYINHLTDFIKTIENLYQTMENSKLNKYFKENFETIEELNTKFSEYKNSFYRKIDLLKDLFTSNKAIKIWKYNGSTFVIDYIISENYKIAIDCFIDIGKGWEIQLLGRSPDSRDFLFNTMLKSKIFSHIQIELNNSKDRLIFSRLSIDTDISEVQKKLIELTELIENFMIESEKQKNN